MLLTPYLSHSLFKHLISLKSSSSFCWHKVNLTISLMCSKMG
jgi:hypothetical protein